MKRTILIGAAVGALAVAGGATAASRWVVSNIHQIRPSVVSQLRGHRGPRGARGPAGFQSVQTVTGPTTTMAPGDVESSVATCPGGTTVTGGGWDGEGAPPVENTVAFNEALGSDSWEVIMASSASINTTFAAIAQCAGGSGFARDTSVTKLDAAQRRQLARDLAAARRADG